MCLDGGVAATLVTIRHALSISSPITFALEFRMLIAVDGGATHCRLAVFDDQGERVADCRLAQHASLTLGVEEACATVQQGIDSLQEAVGQSLGSSPLYCGLAGSLRTGRRQAFIEVFSATRRVEITTDGHAQLLGATGGEAGACLAVGTGSVVHWRDSGGVLGMAGGWGYPVGDQASAAWLGLQLLQRYVEALDRRQALTGVFAAVQEKVGGEPEQIQAWTTSHRSSEVAALAPLVSQFVAQGDQTATQLVDRGIEECERLYACVPADLPRWITGGLAELYQPGLERRGVRFEAVRGDALEGLSVYARSIGEA